MHQLLLFISLLTLSTLHPSTSQQQCSRGPVRAGYWLPQSSHYSPLPLINTSPYTHLYYYSLSIDETSSTIALPPPGQLLFLTTFSATLKASNPSLKTLLSIATDDRRTDASNAAFSSMASDPALRAAFIDSAMGLARANAFDGLDLAWRFPSSSSDMANLGLLLAEWRARIDGEAQDHQQTLPPLLMTATVYFSNHLFDAPNDDLYYPMDAVSSNLDWLNAVCFHYHNNGEVTAADAALYDTVSHFSTSYGITSWLDSGVPSCKLVMGIPLYGRSWFLKNKAKNGIGAPVVAAGPRQKLSNQTGVMAYFEIEELLSETASLTLYDNKTVSAYFHTGGMWVSFDSPEAVEAKIQFALRNVLLGYFLWPISFDDSNYTISKQASDLWLRNPASDLEGESGGYVEALSPVQLPPQDDAATTSAAVSGFRRIDRTKAYQFSFVFLFFNLLFLLSDLTAS